MAREARELPSASEWKGTGLPRVEFSTENKNPKARVAVVTQPE